MAKKYQYAALGGTFDRLHAGHHHLIDTAVKNSNQIIVGLTTKKLYKHKEFSQIILPYKERKKDLSKFIESKGVTAQVDIMPLQDIYGPTINNGEIDLIVVSQQTKPGAKIINQKRKSLQLKPLPVKVADLITDESGKYISSTRIRQGLINRQGRSYAQIFNSSISLTPKQKKIISVPQGKLFKQPPNISRSDLLNSPKIALIGDSVTQYFIDHKLPFNYCVIDHLVRRQPYKVDLKSSKPTLTLTTNNPPGKITRQSFNTIQKLLNSDSGLIDVSGEEDLLGFPFALLLPINSLVIYGQPKQGIVIIRLTETKKDQIAHIIDSSY